MAGRSLVGATTLGREQPRERGPGRRGWQWNAAEQRHGQADAQRYGTRGASSSRPTAPAVQADDASAADVAAAVRRRRAGKVGGVLANRRGIRRWARTRCIERRARREPTRPRSASPSPARAAARKVDPRRRGSARAILTSRADSGARPATEAGAGATCAPRGGRAGNRVAASACVLARRMNRRTNGPRRTGAVARCPAPSGRGRSGRQGKNDTAERAPRRTGPPGARGGTIGRAGYAIGGHAQYSGSLHPPRWRAAEERTAKGAALMRAGRARAVC